jgi:hypothetical protein
MIAVLLALLTGCASPQYQWTSTPQVDTGRVRVVRVDDGFSNSQVSEIVQGIGLWNHVLNGQIRLQIDLGTIDIVKDVRRADSVLTLRILPEYDWASKKDCGWVTDPGVGARVLYVVVGREGCHSVLETFVHEMGHVLGARHSVGAMSNPPENVCIGRETVEQVAKVQGIDPAKMNYCEEVK